MQIRQLFSVSVSARAKTVTIHSLKKLTLQDPIVYFK